MLFYGVPFLSAQTPLSKQTAEEAAIRKVLNEQTINWNKGDIDSFMQGYWKSDSLQFIGSSGITTGWQNTLNNYKKRYPDQATRGTLRFDILRVEMLGNNTAGQPTALVVGKFYLTRPEKGDAQGYFTLLWRKVNGHWVIMMDHTS